MPRGKQATPDKAAAPAKAATGHDGNRWEGLRLSIRMDLPGGARIGPGKVALLEAIGREGSISAGGRSLHMSYRRAWALVEELNAALGTALVVATAGGAGGGGARLTPAGAALVAGYRAIERRATAFAAKQMAGPGTPGAAP
ncbi:MAG: LysR family transcriptional regulator [Rhodospirillales bacterium]|nr:LysR family transcriptional regulator [Rhodospirillales bacterium]